MSSKRIKNSARGEKVAKVYIAGPMTGYPEFNYPAFHSTAGRLRCMGFDVISPAELNPIDPSLKVDEKYHAELYPSYIRRDITALLECDHICMLKGWQASKGATLEHHIARVLGMIQITIGDEENGNHTDVLDEQKTSGDLPHDQRGHESTLSQEDNGVGARLTRDLSGPRSA